MDRAKSQFSRNSSLVRCPLHDQTECTGRELAAVDGDRIDGEERGRRPVARVEVRRVVIVVVHRDHHAEERQISGTQWSADLYSTAVYDEWNSRTPPLVTANL